MTLDEALRSNDMEEIYDSMAAYVYRRFRLLGVKHLEGKTPEDFVAEVFYKVVENDRDWSKAKCTFKEFLFGCLRSHLYSFFKGFKYRFTGAVPDDESHTDGLPVEDAKLLAINFLQNEGADEIELKVFECWCEGYFKPQEIAELLHVEVSEVNNIRKRLIRKLPNLQSQLTVLL